MARSRTACGLGPRSARSCTAARWRSRKNWETSWGAAFSSEHLARVAKELGELDKAREIGDKARDLFDKLSMRPDANRLKGFLDELDD